MSRNLLASLVFLAGLVAVGWIGLGYLGNHPLACAVIALIGMCYLAGAAELLRYRQASAGLARALADIAQAGSDADGWLARLTPALRSSVRLRLEGERAGLPAPALTPYLVGLLVLLGMLGTLLGMMVTLRGTGLALQSATDLDAIRSSLAAPVKGLGFAFGTSIAGVSSSAALGLLSALLRRERALVVQQLDAAVATLPGLRSPARRQQESLRLQQAQHELLPPLVQRLEALADTLERRQHAADARLEAAQQAFHARSETAWSQLAASLQQALHAGIAQQAEAVGGALQPVVDATMAGLAAQSQRLHASIESAVQRQLDGLDAAVQGAASAARDSWRAAIEEQQRGNAALSADLQQGLQQFTAGFAAHADALAERMATQLDTQAERSADAWAGALARQQAAHETLATRSEQSWQLASAGFEQRTRAVLDSVQQSQVELQSAFAARSEAMIHALQASHGDLQDSLQARDGERLTQWHATFAALTAEFGERWNADSARLAAQQAEVCATLQHTAQAMGEQAQTQATATLAEIARLVDTAAEAPRAAAAVVAELREKLSDSMARDTATLAERGELLATVQTLLAAVNHAAHEQRGAIDALVERATELLEHTGSRFSAQVESESGRLDAAAAHVTGSAVEVASLGEAFGGAVLQFGDAAGALGERLQAIEAALAAAQTRSDEQLAYYVAQAREVIELSMLSQKQIIGELQQLAAARDGAEA